MAGSAERRRGWAACVSESEERAGGCGAEERGEWPSRGGRAGGRRSGEWRSKEESDVAERSGRGAVRASEEDRRWRAREGCGKVARDVVCNA